MKYINTQKAIYVPESNKAVGAKYKSIVAVDTDDYDSIIEYSKSYIHKLTKNRELIVKFKKVAEKLSKTEMITAEQKLQEIDQKLDIANKNHQKYLQEKENYEKSIE